MIGGRGGAVEGGGLLPGGQGEGGGVLAGVQERGGGALAGVQERGDEGGTREGGSVLNLHLRLEEA